MKKQYKFIFHNDYSRDIALVFGNKLDSENYLIDSEGNRVLTRDKQEINIKEFAGVAQGSRIYLKSDITSLIEYIDMRRLA